MKYELKRLPKKLIELVLTIEWKDVAATYDAMLDEVVKNAEIKGFRKGKAPRSTVENNLNKDVFYQEVVNKLVSKHYSEIVQKENFHPVVYPRVETVSREEGKDWVFKVMFCEAPDVDLVNYKEVVASIHAKDKIWVPGKDQTPEGKQTDEEKNKKINDSLAKILEVSKVEISDMLLEEETSKLLSELLEEIKKLGLSLDQYLASTGKNAEVLRDEYRKKAQNSLTLEFVLNKIAETENITVSDDDLKNALNEVKEETLRKQLENSSYQLAAILRRQKTLDFIASL